jgi:type III pantothenate kinase
VVDAGTAVTVDALTGEGMFLGGLILPGIDLMSRALAAGTAGLGMDSGSFERFPRSTTNAIRSGAMHAISGAIERMVRTLQEHEQRPPQVVLAGGAAPLIVPRLSMPAILAPGLVLEGLIGIAQE